MAILFMEGFDHWDITTTGGGYSGNGDRQHPIKNFGDYADVGSFGTIGEVPYDYRTFRDPNIAITSVAKFSDFGRYYQPRQSLYRGWSVFDLKQQSTSTIYIQYYYFSSGDHRTKGIGIPSQLYLEYSPLYKTCSLYEWANGTPMIVSYVDDSYWRHQSWNFIEVQFVLGLSGSFTFRINNQEVATANNIQTQYNFAYTAYQVGYFDPGYTTLSNASGPIDHVIVYDNSGSTNNDWIGEAKIVTVYPNNDGYYRTFTPERNLEMAIIETIEYAPEGRVNIDPLAVSETFGYLNPRARYVIPIPWEITYMGKNYGLGQVNFIDFGVIYFGDWYWDQVTQGNWTTGEEPIIGSWYPSSPKLILNYEFGADRKPAEVYGGLCEDCLDGFRKYRLWCGSTSYYNGIERNIEYEVIFYEDQPDRIDVHTVTRHFDGIRQVTSNTTSHGTFTMEPKTAFSITTLGPTQQNYRMVNDVIIMRNIDNSDYGNVSHVRTNTVGSIESYQFESIPDYPGLDIRAVQTTINARKNDVGNKRIASVFVANSNTSLYVATPTYLGLTDQFHTEIFEVNPITSSNWTANSINNMEFGFKLVD